MPDRAEVVDRLNKVFRDVFADEGIFVTDDTTAADVEGWDSVAHITLVLATEREFRIRLTAAEVGALKNVGQMVNLITTRAR